MTPLDAELPAPVASLFPSPADRVRWDDFLTRALLEANERVSRGSAVPTLDMDAFRRDLTAFDFGLPHGLDELLPWTIAQIERGVVHMTHPRYFGLFNPAPTFPALCGDRIAGAFNPQLATWSTAPAAVEIERHVIEAVARRAGLPPGSTGHFTSGGSEANYTASICALTRANPAFAAEGARAFAGPPVFYISRESHLAWLKIAHQAGIGRSAARLVPTDGTGRMDANALDDVIANDLRSGAVPVMIVATAGTTNAGMIDPLTACGDIARRNGMWYHVDAAWGGATIASEKWHGVLVGIETADSVTIDAHKWFATTMGCGMFLTRHPAILSAAFHVATDFMPSNLANLDPYVTTAQWSRRFLGLRFFLSLAAAGWSGYGEHIDRSIALVEELRRMLTDRGWRIANDSRLALLCVEPPDGRAAIRAVANRVLASGQGWVAVAKFEGRDTLRVCLTHGESTINDLTALTETLEGAATGSG